MRRPIPSRFASDDEEIGEGSDLDVQTSVHGNGISHSFNDMRILIKQISGIMFFTDWYRSCNRSTPQYSSNCEVTRTACVSSRPHAECSLPTKH